MKEGFFYDPAPPEDANQKEQRVKEAFENNYSNLFEENPELFEYVRRYKSDAYYTDINGVARLGKEGYLEWLVSRGQIKEKAAGRVEGASEIINHLEDFFKESILVEDMSVYRQVSYRTIEEIKKGQGLFTDNGFVSTSFTLEDAKKYHKQFTIRIDIPAGTRAVDMTSALKSTNWSKSANWENELVIDRGYTYEVIPESSDDYLLILRLRK